MADMVTARIRLVERTKDGETTYQVEVEDMVSGMLGGFGGYIGPKTWNPLGPPFKAAEHAR